ncbi:hypothetical protein NQ315_004946 [Exocentrus adspersus]|uniref:FHA domain-containing protein n=1 Tax=Exocentrus adspersus TaxID=1586481 RepID=A0AAV8W395_9CUCU|nr:hypothetical protein NQ315_004946 [Exocentrus adspersus]
MLFLLKNINDGRVFYLTGKDQFLVGRKECDFLIQDDQSISRKHAIIRLKENKVTVEDCGSKYNTLYRGERLIPNTEIEITVGDNIHFGVSISLYRLDRYEFVTTGSRLNSDAKSNFLRGYKKNLPPPDINHHNKPPVAEKLLNRIDLQPNPERKILYKGKQFIFEKEEDRIKMEQIIKKAGGTSISWEKNRLPIENMKSAVNDFIFIQTGDEIYYADLKQLIQDFLKRGKRTIPVQEIAMSILHCSCEKDCNPNFNRVKQVFPASKPKEPTQNNALAADSESQYFSFKTEAREGPSVIPDTFEKRLDELETPHYKFVANEDKDTSQSKKRINVGEAQEAPSKKIKTDKENKTDKVKQETADSYIAEANSSKRKCSEEVASNSMNESGKHFNIKKTKTEPNVSSKNCPFKVTRRQLNEINDDNPFKLSLGSRKRGNADASDESICKKKKEDNIFSSTRIENVSHSLFSVSRISRINKNVANSTWMTKNSTNVTADLNQSVENEFDIDMRHFIDRFKNTVIVEIMEAIPTRSSIMRNVGAVKSSKGGVNFKVFKKVMPMRPQNQIIGRANFTLVDPKSTTGIVDTKRVFHNSDDEDEANFKVKKRIPKKFSI